MLYKANSSYLRLPQSLLFSENFGCKLQEKDTKGQKCATNEPAAFSLLLCRALAGGNLHRLLGGSVASEQHSGRSGHRAARREGADALEQQLQRVAHGVGSRAAGDRVAAGAAGAALEPRRRAARGAERAEEGQRRGEARVIGGVERAVRAVALHEGALRRLGRGLQRVSGKPHVGRRVSGLRRRHG